MKRRRGTAIVQTKSGILLTRILNDPFLLPGGNSEPGEPRIVTAIRELKEETNLSAESVTYLFDYESKYYTHKVFLISAIGKPTASNEITSISYYPIVDIKLISNSSLQIIKKFLDS